MSATRCPLVVEASQSKRCASFRLRRPMLSLASCRGGLAPRCRCSEALGFNGPGAPGRLSIPTACRFFSHSVGSRRQRVFRWVKTRAWRNKAVGLMIRWKTHARKKDC
jgi:hypothetical protein